MLLINWINNFNLILCLLIGIYRAINFLKVADFIDQGKYKSSFKILISNFLTKFFFHSKGFKLAVEINKETSGTKTLKDFKEKMNDELTFKSILYWAREKNYTIQL